MLRISRIALVALFTVVVVAPELWQWPPPSPVPPPRPLLIFYGSLPDQASRPQLTPLETALKGYNLVVVHSGLESPGNPSGPVLAALIRAMPQVAFYGYLALGVSHGEPDYTLSQIRTDLARWQRLGVRGMLLDTAGHDYGVSTARLAAAMTAAHQLGLRLIVNAYRPQDVLAAPWAAGDIYLAENWALSAGTAPGPRAELTLHSLYRLEMRGVMVAATATEARGWPFADSRLDQAVLATMDMVPGIRWLAVAGPNYSASTGAIVPALLLQRAVAGQTRDY